MKNGWPTETLAEACQIKPPKSEARDNLSGSDLVSFLPMEDMGIDQMFVKPSQAKPFREAAGSYTYFAEGDVLLAKITPCFENGKLGIASGLKNGIGFGSSEYIVFRPYKSVRKEWLYYFLSRESFRVEGAARMSGAVGHKRVAKEFIEAYPIPVPPLPEQLRVVGILDEAFDGIATAKANAEKNFQNARALFRAVFGAITTESGKEPWLRTKVAEVAAPRKGAIRTGPFGSQLLHSEFVEKGIAVLGIDNAVANEFRWGKGRFITPKKYRLLERYRVHPGDVLITIMGTCGRCAIVPEDIPTAINTKHLCCITLDRNKCLPGYLHAYFLYHPVAREFLSKHAKGAIMAGLNMGLIEELPLLLPSLERQRKIISTLDSLKAETQRLESLYQQKLAAMDSLKKSLLHQAFTGKL